MKTCALFRIEKGCEPEPIGFSLVSDDHEFGVEQIDDDVAYIHFEGKVEITEVTDGG